ncbi:MAG: DUF177 domain-containing protein [Actinobacteria bacterium]|nr:DUF177 domain-containing protein [Actinomycetota bacterium]
MTLPSLRLIDIPEEGLNVSCAVRPDEIALGIADAQVQDLLTVSADVHKAGDIVSVQGSVAATFIRQCVRCLKDYDTVVSIPFSVQYQQQQGPQMPGRPSESKLRAKPSGPEKVLDEADNDEQDTYPFTGDSIELATMLREQVILATPMQPLCNAECLGICPVCGQDRNERNCGCAEQTEESPFAALRELRDRVQRKVDPQRN